MEDTTAPGLPYTPHVSILHNDGFGGWQCHATTARGDQIRLDVHGPDDEATHRAVVDLLRRMILAANTVGARIDLDGDKSTQPASTSIREIWPDLPSQICGDAVIPPGYRWHLAGIVIEHADHVTQVCRWPIIIGHRSVTDGLVQISLLWRVDEIWHCLVCMRQEVFDRHLILNLAHGKAGMAFPVTTENVELVISWLRAYEHANLDVITMRP